MYTLYTDFSYLTRLFLFNKIHIINIKFNTVEISIKLLVKNIIVKGSTSLTCPMCVVLSWNLGLRPRSHTQDCKGEGSLCRWTALGAIRRIRFEIFGTYVWLISYIRSKWSLIKDIRENKHKLDFVKKRERENKIK